MGERALAEDPVGIGEQAVLGDDGRVELVGGVVVRWMEPEVVSEERGGLDEVSCVREAARADGELYPEPAHLIGVDG